MYTYTCTLSPCHIFLQAPVAPGHPLQLSPLQSKVKGGLLYQLNLLHRSGPSLSTSPFLQSSVTVWLSFNFFLSDPSVCKKCGQRGRRSITKWTKNKGRERERMKSTCTYGESHLELYCLSSIIFDTTINK